MELKFDQHFLKNNDTLLLTINEANIKKEDIIYEIGPGQGILTTQILKKHPKLLISIEKDPKMKEFLEKIKQTHKNTFKYEINKDGVEEMGNNSFTKLIANIPYSITEPLYKRILDKKIEFAILLHGNDFYKKINIPNNKWYYFINAFYTITLLKEVPGTDFEPKTKTKSSLLKLELKPQSKQTKFDEFLQILYSKKKRTPINAIIFSLVDTLELSKKQIKEKFKTPKLSKLISTFNASNETTLENISNNDFTQLINEIESDFFSN